MRYYSTAPYILPPFTTNTMSNRPSRPARFSIEFSGDAAVKESVKAKLQQVRNILTERDGPTTNTGTLDQLLDYWLANNCTAVPQRAVNRNRSTSTLLQLSKEQIFHESIVMITSSTLTQLLDLTSSHQRCPGILSIDLSSTAYQGFAQRLSLRCSENCNQFRSRKGKVLWNSPRDLGGNFVINDKMLHAFFSSGMLPIHFKRLFTAAGITMAVSFIRNTHLRTKYIQATSEVNIKANNMCYYQYC